VTIEGIETPSRADRFQALCELSQEMALVEDEWSIYRVVLEVARKVLDFFNCAILLVDEQTQELVIVDEQGYPAGTRGMRIALLGERGISRWVAVHGEALYVPDVRLDDRYVSGVPQARSELAVPIKIRNRVLGVLNVESDNTDAFDKDEALLLQALASQLAVALELNRARAELDRLTITDPLTGVYNRRYLDRVLPTEQDRAERFDRPFALMMLDLDDFKSVNDRYGHRQGDHILVAFAQALQRNVRSIDAVVRYGGDEFLVVLLETDAEGAGKACERIRKRVVEALERSPAVPAEASIGVSVGLAVRNPGENIDEKLAEADQRMYNEKRRTEMRRDLRLAVGGAESPVVAAGVDAEREQSVRPAALFDSRPGA
jgi:diguanylate cyclase (GGDEF)-like protein